MLDLFGGLLSLFLSQEQPKLQALQSTNWSPLLTSSWLQAVVQPPPDAVTVAAVQQHLNGIVSLGAPGSAQGVWIQTGNQVLAEYNGTVPASAASLSKIATTLVALDTWGPDRQFETTVSATAPPQNGVIQGDLIVQGSGDPFFVWEEAIALGNALNQAGVRRVSGNLIVVGNFAMNFDTDAATSGAWLKQAIDASQWTGSIEAAYQNLAPGTARPEVTIAGGVLVAPVTSLPVQIQPIVRHQSLPLLNILKAMNIYSNNIMAEMIADSLGGAAAVSRQAATLAQVPPAEIQLINGSGLGLENRISPRAATSMLIAIQRYLQPRQLNVSDLFPVSGRDVGTLAGRRIPAAAAVKTGTLNEVSALAGVLPTRDRDLVWFAVINYGTGDIGNFHDQQDRLLQNLQQSWGVPAVLPPTIKPTPGVSSESTRLGAADRNRLGS